jgi:hypothetical protein
MKRGRPKGYSPYAEITYEELGDWVGRKTIVKVSKSWLEELTREISPSPAPKCEPVKDEPKIEFHITDFNDYK